MLICNVEVDLITRHSFPFHCSLFIIKFIDFYGLFLLYQTWIPKVRYLELMKDEKNNALNGSTRLCRARRPWRALDNSLILGMNLWPHGQVFRRCFWFHLGFTSRWPIWTNQYMGLWGSPSLFTEATVAGVILLNKTLCSKYRLELLLSETASSTSPSKYIVLMEPVIWMGECQCPEVPALAIYPFAQPTVIAKSRWLSQITGEDFDFSLCLQSLADASTANMLCNLMPK